MNKIITNKIRRKFIVLSLALLTSVSVCALENVNFVLRSSLGYEHDGASSNIGRTYNSELTLGVSNAIDDHWSYIFSTGYILSRSLQQGSGRIYTWYNTSAIPICFDMNWANDNTSRFSTIFGARLGYDISLESARNTEMINKESMVYHDQGYYDDGFSFMPHAGVLFNSSDSFASQISVGYKFHLNSSGENYMINQFVVSYTIYVL